MKLGLLVQAAQQEVLQSLLQDVSITADNSALKSLINSLVATKAKELGVELDLTQTNRGIYGGKV